MKKDITTREDLHLLMSEFYKKLLADSSISYLFTDVAKIDLSHHLNVLVDFWEMLLFQKDSYRKNAMQPHIHVHQQFAFQPHHFKTWIGYFQQTIDSLFTGPVAQAAKQKACGVAGVMELKLKQFPSKE